MSAKSLIEALALHTKLSFHIVQTPYLLGKGSLESCGTSVKLGIQSVMLQRDCVLKTYISELNLSDISQCTDNLSPNLVSNVQLHHAHVRGAEHGVLSWCHAGGCKDLLHQAV